MASLRSPQFGNIILGGKDAHREESVGTLKLHPDGVGWKSRKTGNIISVSKADLRAAEWIKIPHAYQLKLRARGGFVYKYNGDPHAVQFIFSAGCVQTSLRTEGMSATAALTIGDDRN